MSVASTSGWTRPFVGKSHFYRRGNTYSLCGRQSYDDQRLHAEPKIGQFCIQCLNARTREEGGR